MSDAFSNGHPRPDTSDGSAHFEVLALIKSDGPIKANDIAKRLNLESDLTDVKVRQIITELIVEYIQPIASDCKGFFMARDRDAIAAYNAQLCSRRDEIEKRRQAFLLAAAFPGGIR